MGNNTENKLWYDRPAAAWTEALPLGNGSIGAMVFGDTSAEIISLNRDTLWTGFPDDTDNPEAFSRVEEARALLRTGENHAAKAAQDLIERYALGRDGDAYLPFGDMEISFLGDGTESGYRRELDLTQGICTVSYTKGGVRFTREIFVSHPQDMLAMKISADAPALDFDLALRSPLRNTVCCENGILVLSGECPGSNDLTYSDDDSRRGVCFTGAVKIVSDGKILPGAERLSVRGAREAFVYFALKTSFAGFDRHPFLDGLEHRESAVRALDAADLGYPRIRQAHIADHTKYYGRTALHLEGADKTEIPTDRRLRDFAENRDDPGLYSLMFDFGRYLAIASSRENSQPANLQGIWNKEVKAPWKSNYTLNINTEMNYWPMLVCGLSELAEPLHRMIAELRENGRKTARINYNARGFVSHHNTDLWRKTTPVSGWACWSFWPLSAGWLCRHLFEYYRFMLDENFLRERAFPLMKDAALFFCDFLTLEDGRYVMSPATSPENRFICEGGESAVTLNATMSTAIVRELFENCLEAADILGIGDSFTAEVGAKLAKLYPYKIGSRGQLLEWDTEYEEHEPHHRHVSHLYGLYPAAQMTYSKTPELMEACKRTLEERGDEGTGWSLAWKISFFARLKDGDHALKLIDRQLRFIPSDEGEKVNMTSGGTYANLFDAHPPFQIDGNFGFTAGVAEMLLQSHEDFLHILPALPKRWESGSVRGLAARGGLTADIEWSGGEIKRLALTATRDMEVEILYGRQACKARKFRLHSGENVFSASELNPA